MPKKLLIYNMEAFNNLESLLVSSVSTVLVIRFYLQWTNYPQVGGGELHIAHMLWGGLLMLIALILPLAFLNTSTHKVAAILGGIGFGTFIDELGKFITRTNDYFFEPTIALIYVIFVLLFLTFQLLKRKQTLSETDYINNAFELTRMALLDTSDVYKKEQAEELLLKCHAFHPAVVAMKAILGTIQTSDKNEHALSRFNTFIHSLYKNLIAKKLLTRFVIIFFVAHSLYSFYRALDVISLYFRLENFQLSFIDWGEFIFSSASGLVVIVGILLFRLSSIRGYRTFRIAVLISIFLTQFFNFYKSQLEGVILLFFNIFVLFILQYVISEEQIGTTVTVPNSAEENS